MCLTGARHDLTQARNLALEIAHSGSQKLLEQDWIKGAEFLAQPVLTRKRFLRIEAVETVRIGNQVKTQLDHQKGMLSQKASKLARVDQTLTDAQQKGFDVGGFGMAWSPTRRAGGFPLLDHRPVERREKGARINNDRIMIEQSGDGGLVKEDRIGYHSRKLLCVSGMLLLSKLCKRVFALSSPVSSAFA